MPFSNQLNFLGNQIPYWYYVSANNIQEEQVPKITDMQDDLAEFVESRISNCRFDSYYEQGFLINFGQPSAKMTIRDNQVEVDLNMNLNIAKGEIRVR